MLILSLIAAVITYPLWMWIHEYSHIRAANKYVGVEWYKMYLYPHKFNGVFYWARCQYLLKREPSSYELYKIAEAPRIPDFIACILLILASAFHLYPLVILLLGGVIDLFIGSLGIHPESDIQKEARYGRMNLWYLRTFNMLYITWTLLHVVRFLF